MSLPYPHKPTHSADTAYDDGYDHGIRGISAGCSYYLVGTVLHREYERGYSDGYDRRRQEAVNAGEAA